MKLWVKYIMAPSVKWFYMNYGNIPIEILCNLTVDNLHDNSSQFTGVQQYNTIQYLTQGLVKTITY